LKVWIAQLPEINSKAKERKNISEMYGHLQASLVLLLSLKS